MRKIMHTGGLALWLFIAGACSEGKTAADIKDIPAGEGTEIAFSSPGRLVSYVSESGNGYYKEKEIGDIKFSALLKPLDYLKAKALMKGCDSSDISADDDLQYFDLRIKVKNFKMEFLKYNLAGAADYYNRVSYCAFGMQDDIVLVDGKDTLNCALFHFERAYDVVPYGHFLLAFAPSRNKNFTSKTLVYHDRLFNKGLIKFTFTPGHLSKVPKLINA